MAVCLLAALAGILIPTKTAAAVPNRKQSNIVKVEQVTSPIIEPSKPIELNKPVLPPAKKAVFKTATPSAPQVYSGRDYSPSEVQQLIRDYSAQYGISADLPLRVANCESGFQQSSKNRNSTASGVYQYLQTTWSHTEAGRAGISAFDADANVHMAIKSIASGGISNWAASAACWNK